MKLFKNIVSIFLALVILVSTAGITVVEHICHDSGQVHIALLGESHSCCDHSTEEKCCGNQTEHCEIEDISKCCQETLITYKLDIPVEYSNYKISTPKVLDKGEIVFLCQNNEDESLKTIFISNDEIIRENSPPLFILYHQLKIASSDIRIA